ncbi:sulfatase [Echinicola marina]|uniref:sulfatase n=1 Tax=Echinicola marina TaxID=2859768 RepID=UPI001CF628FE|nr:sulfatase [Echinicola marina]UCS94024.1 sulfatase [Echinicola marina]
MCRHKLVLSITLCFFYIGYSYCLGKDHQANKPNKKPVNIILIMADDLGWGELGCYGNSFNETPNLDKMAQNGLLFSHAYAAAPVCSPTRASLMTGQYPARVGITDFLAPKSERFLDPQQYVTMNEALNEEGYQTGIIGKWHLETNFINGLGGPQNHGFDEIIATETKYIADGDYFAPYDKIASLAGEEGEFLADRLALEAEKFIERNKEAPFFLYLSHYSVHTTLAAPETTVNKYKRKFDEKYGVGMADKLFENQRGNRHRSKHKDNPYLAAMLEHVDQGLGRILEKLEACGIAENTLVIFFSDNGGAGNVANNGGLRANKTWLYEGGIREPLLMTWPGNIQPGTVCDVPVSSIDFYPTFLSLANGKKKYKANLDGIDLSDLITDGKKPSKRPLFWHYPSETGNWENRMASAVQYEGFKLLEFYEDGRLELYHLEEDEAETENLVKSMPQKVEALQGLLEKWKTEVKAEIPVIQEK